MVSPAASSAKLPTVPPVEAGSSASPASAPPVTTAVGSPRRAGDNDSLTIANIAQLTGISPSALRIWESRYHWPIPPRQANRYRRYTAAQLAALLAVRDLLDQGMTIGEIMADPVFSPLENPTLSRALLSPPRPQRPRLDFSQVPLPLTPAGRQIRERLETALQSDDRGAIARAEAEGQRLRPDERERAVTSVLRTLAPKASPLS